MHRDIKVSYLFFLFHNSLCENKGGQGIRKENDSREEEIKHKEVH